MSDDRTICWVLPDEDLVAALRAVADGQDPDLVRVELYANADVEQLDG